MHLRPGMSQKIQVPTQHILERWICFITLFTVGCSRLLHFGNHRGEHLTGDGIKKWKRWFSNESISDARYVRTCWIVPVIRSLCLIFLLENLSKYVNGRHLAVIFSISCPEWCLRLFRNLMLTRLNIYQLFRLSKTVAQTGAARPADLGRLHIRLAFPQRLNLHAVHCSQLCDRHHHIA